MVLLSPVLRPLPLWLWRWLFVAGSLLTATGGRAQSGASEYQVKAVFLFNFAQFVTWPEGAFATPTSPLVIGVLGEDPFGGDLDDTLRGEVIGSRPLVARRFKTVEEIDACHVLFIGRSESAELGSIAAALRDRAILTVGDTEGYALRGVMIRFLADKNRIRLRINLDAAKAAGLILSSKLLRPAEIVTTREN